MSYMYWLCLVDFDSTSESVVRRIAAQQFADVAWSDTELDLGDLDRCVIGRVCCTV
jgi:hypothetical protein